MCISLSCYNKDTKECARDDGFMVEGYRETIKSPGQELNFVFSRNLHLDFKRAHRDTKVLIVPYLGV